MEDLCQKVDELMKYLETGPEGLDRFETLFAAVRNPIRNHWPKCERCREKLFDLGRRLNFKRLELNPAPDCPSLHDIALIIQLKDEYREDTDLEGGEKHFQECLYCALTAALFILDFEKIRERRKGDKNAHCG
jgi:hypothetical protein